MTKHLFSLLAFLLLLLNFSIAQSGCPNCVIDLPTLPSDTIFLGSSPDGEAMVPYDEDVSFRMPKTTTPVHEIDPGTPAGLNISKLTIIAMLNVPPGLSWEPSQFEFDPGNETDGCVKFCGTPLVPGYYEMQIFVTAQVLTLNQSTSFTMSIYIAPSTSTTTGFGLQNSVGCGEVTVSFENLILSNGDAGFDYFWDFGNGEVSNEENPGDITYSIPGIYEINYEAIVDTSEYEFTTVQIVDAGCNDLSLPPISNAPPELYIKIKDPSGDEIYVSDKINNAPLPSAFNVNIPLGPGDYTLEVRDDDLFGSDHCGTVTFNRMTNDTLEDGSLKVELSIIHPVFTIQSTDTVFVYEIPEPPIIIPAGVNEICEGEELVLEADYAENLQWYKDSIAVLGATDSTFTTSSSGIYWVEYTSPDGCSSVSEALSLLELPLPATPSFSEDGNWLEVLNPDLLPDDFSLQWYINGDAIPDANETSFCNTFDGVNLFTLEVTDNTTGCTNEFSIGVAFDPNADCTVATNELAAIGQSLRIFPNPANESLNVVFENENLSEVNIRILDVMGRQVSSHFFQHISSEFHEKLNLSDLNSGIYFLEIFGNNGRVVRRIVKE